VDLEKAFDKVPREVMQWAMRRLSVEEWLVGIIMKMYEGSRTSVRVNHVLSDNFTVKGRSILWICLEPTPVYYDV